MLDWNRIATLAQGAIDARTREQTAVYVDPRIHPAGSEVSIGRDVVRLTEPGVIAFIDLAPQSNWGHPCRYVLIGAASGTVRVVDGQLPPPVDQLRLVHRGAEVEEWMLLTTKGVESP